MRLAANRQVVEVSKLSRSRVGIWVMGSENYKNSGHMTTLLKPLH